MKVIQIMRKVPLRNPHNLHRGRRFNPVMKKTRTDELLERNLMRAMEIGFRNPQTKDQMTN